MQTILPSIVLSEFGQLESARRDSILSALRPTKCQVFLSYYYFGGNVPLIILITLLLLCSWLFTEVLVLVPIDLLNSLRPFMWVNLGVVVLVFLWCFGGE
jgi:hypothetical protein